MTEKELRKMRPQDIIQLLVVQGNEASQLQAEIDMKNQRLGLYQSANEVLKAKLNDRDALTELLKMRLDISDVRIQEMENKLKEERADRRIDIEETGSIMRAAQELEAIFKAAQQEANQYLGIDEPEEEEQEQEELLGGILQGIQNAGAGVQPGMQNAGAGVQPGIQNAGAGVQPGMQNAGAENIRYGMGYAGSGNMPSGMQNAGIGNIRRGGMGTQARAGVQPGGKRAAMQPQAALPGRMRTVQPGMRNVSPAGKRTVSSGVGTIQSGTWIDAGIVMPGMPPAAELSQPDMRIAAALGLASVHVTPEEFADVPETADRKKAVKKSGKGIFGTLRTRKRRS